MLDLDSIFEGRPGGIIGVLLRALGLIDKGGMSAADAGRGKLAFLLGGGDPAKVVSPERLAALRRGGPDALAAMPAQRRADGSIAAGYKPTSQALREGLIEPRAVPVVRQAEASGIRTFSSGVDKRTGAPFAIGFDPVGKVVEIQPGKG